MAELFAIKHIRSSNIALGQGTIQVSTYFGDPRFAAIEYSLGRVHNGRDVSVIAHEFGHLFYASLVELSLPDDNHNHLARSAVTEKFCWDFSREFLLPDDDVRQWNSHWLNSLLSDRENESLNQHRPQNAPSIGFVHLCAIAKRYHVSIRLVLTSLDRCPLLDEICVGIAIIAYRENQFMKNAPALRIRFAARPSWGHVIFNQRVLKQGFSQANDAYRFLGHMKNTWRDEILLLQNKCAMGPRKWEVTEIRTVCEYAAIDVLQEGRYLVAIWQWPYVEKR